MEPAREFDVQIGVDPCRCVEKRKLVALVEEFAGVMLDKLIMKTALGFDGWETLDAVDNLDHIHDHLPESTCTDQEEILDWDPIDIANFAAFEWYRRKREERETS